MKLHVAAAAAAFSTALGQAASAAQEMPAPGVAHYGAFTCRIAANRETLAERALGFDTMLVCKPAESIGVLKPNAAALPGQPVDDKFDASHALSPVQMNDAWKAYIDQTFSIEHSS